MTIRNITLYKSENCKHTESNMKPIIFTVFITSRNGKQYRVTNGDYPLMVADNADIETTCIARALESAAKEIGTDCTAGKVLWHIASDNGL